MIHLSSGDTGKKDKKPAKRLKDSLSPKGTVADAAVPPLSGKIPESSLPPSVDKLPQPIKARSGFLSQAESAFDHQVDKTIRPKTLLEYVGQSALKGNLQIALDAAKNRGDVLEHLLLYGPAGLGKTTLSIIIAAEMNAEIHITSAPALERPRDILGILMGMKPGSVLFIDEIHRLNKVAEEILYPAMEDFTLDRTIGKGESTKILRVPMPKFTLVGATTRAGSLSTPLRDRFGMTYRLNFYTHQELSSIIQRSAMILSIAITKEAALTIAQRARGTPRIANRLLRRVRDFVSVKHPDVTTVDETLAIQALELFDIDVLGLDPTDRMMLNLMFKNFSGGPVGLETLASALGEDARTLEEVYEPFMLQCGLIHRTPRGRVLTPEAYKHLGLPLPELATPVNSLPLFANTNETE
jgi:holliday junction DNA helicase RuvB